MKHSEAEIKEKAREEKVPIIQDGGLTFLLDLIRKNNCHRILELGTAVGYSSIEMALLSKEIHIDTVEKEEEMVKEALQNIEEMGLMDQISVHHCPAEEYETEEKYDLIFVDAAKAQYAKYLERFLPNLKEDGMMVFDNMIFHGMIYEVEDLKNRGTKAMVRKIIKFRDAMRNDQRFDIMLYDHIGDGMLVVKRRRS